MEHLCRTITENLNVALRTVYHNGLCLKTGDVLEKQLSGHLTIPMSFGVDN
jgi:hypothetical protein